jgi:hypothetical protein
MGCAADRNEAQVVAAEAVSFWHQKCEVRDRLCLRIFCTNPAEI